MLAITVINSPFHSLFASVIVMGDLQLLRGLGGVANLGRPSPGAGRVRS